MIPEAVHEAMRRRGIRAAQLSELTGVDKGSLSLFLSGKRTIRQGSIEKIFEALGITLEIKDKP